MREENYSTGYSTAPGFLGIGAQSQLDHRYLTEDVGYSLVFLTDLAARLGVPTPVMDAVITIASVVLARDFRARGRCGPSARSASTACPRGARRPLTPQMREDGPSARREENPVSEYVTVERADNEAMADLIRQRLEENGIPCILQSGRMAGIAGAGASYDVTVPAEQAEEAKAVLGDYPICAPHPASRASGPAGRCGSRG